MSDEKELLRYELGLWVAMRNSDQKRTVVEVRTNDRIALIGASIMPLLPHFLKNYTFIEKLKLDEVKAPVVNTDKK